eukprot:s91_g12.t1
MAFVGSLVIKNTFYNFEIEEFPSPTLRRQESSPAKLASEAMVGFPTDITRVETTSGSDGASASWSLSDWWDPQEQRTSVMLKNLPEHFTGDILKELIDKEGFAGAYDFLYMPMKFISQTPFGYAFVNLVSADAVRDFWTPRVY